MTKTILAVDDSSSMRQLVTFTLRSAGYEVVEASDGREALGKLSREIRAHGGRQRRRTRRELAQQPELFVAQLRGPRLLHREGGVIGR